MTSSIITLHSASSMSSSTVLHPCGLQGQVLHDEEGAVTPLPDGFRGTVGGGEAPPAMKVPGAFCQAAASFVGTENAAGAILAPQVTKWPGDLLWEFNAGSPLQAAPAVDESGNLYFGSVGPGGKNGTLWALDSEGNKLWKADAGERILGSPVITGKGLVVVGTMAGRVCAFDRVKGELAWDFMTGEEVRSSPVLSHDGRSLIIGSGDGAVYALDAGSGEKKWSFQTENNGYGPLTGGVNATPALGPDGTVYVGNGCGRFYALDGATGEKKWEADRESGRYEEAAAVGADGTVYVGGPLSGPGWIASGKNRM